MNDLSFYLSAWRLTDPSPLATTENSHLYKVRFEGELKVLKIWTSDRSASDEAAGSIALKYFSGDGAVLFLQGDHSAQLLEYIDGEDLLSHVKKLSDDGDIRIVSSVLKSLHRKRQLPRPLGLVPLSVRYRSLFSFDLTAISAGDRELFQDALQIARQLLDHPLDETVLHGDIHHLNLLRSSSRGWLAIDPKGLLGERTFDTANIFYNPKDANLSLLNSTRIERCAREMSDELELDFKRILSFAFTYGCLSACWSIEDGQSSDQAIHIAKIIRTLL